MGRSVDLTYRIEREEMHWVVSFGGEHCGSFPRRSEAIRSAVEDAKRVRNLGHRVEILVERADGTFRALYEPEVPGGHGGC